MNERKTPKATPQNPNPKTREAEAINAEGQAEGEAKQAEECSAKSSDGPNVGSKGSNRRRGKAIESALRWFGHEQAKAQARKKLHDQIAALSDQLGQI